MITERINCTHVLVVTFYPEATRAGNNVTFNLDWFTGKEKFVNMAQGPRVDVHQSSAEIIYTYQNIAVCLVNLPHFDDPAIPQTEQIKSLLDELLDNRTLPKHEVPDFAWTCILYDELTNPILEAEMGRRRMPGGTVGGSSFD